jgi:hypothetical protein
MSKCITPWVAVPARRAAVIGALAIVAATVSPVAAEQQPTSCPAGRDASCICWTENGIANISCTASMKKAHATTQATRAVADLPGLDPRLTDGERRTYLQKRQDKIDRELLAAQRARFVARASGQSDEQIGTLNRTFTELQQQRHVNLTQLRAAGSDN